MKWTLARIDWAETDNNIDVKRFSPDRNTLELKYCCSKKTEMASLLVYPSRSRVAVCILSFFLLAIVLLVLVAVVINKVLLVG